LAETLDQQLDVLQNGRGFIRLRGLDPKKYDELTLQTMYWGICSYMGTGIPQNSMGELMSGVKDYGDKKCWRQSVQTRNSIAQNYCKN